MLASIIQDLQYGIRQLRQSPGFTLVAVLSLALGIGVNISIFSLVRAAFFRPLPVAHPEELAALYNRSAHGTGSYSSNSYPDFRYFRDHNQVFSGLAAYVRLPLSLRLGDQAEKVSGELVTPDYFSVLGVNPILGRAFFEEEGRETGSHPVAVISHRFWQERLGGDREVLGRGIRLGGRSFTVIGVAPADFRGVVMDWGKPPEIWLPLGMYREAVPALARFDVFERRGMHWLLVVGRLKPEIGVRKAEAALRTLGAQLSHDRPQPGQTWAVTVLPLQSARFWPERRDALQSFLACWRQRWAWFSSSPV